MQTVKAIWLDYWWLILLVLWATHGWLETWFHEHRKRSAYNLWLEESCRIDRIEDPDARSKARAAHPAYREEEWSEKLMVEKFKTVPFILKVCAFCLIGILTMLGK